MANTSFTTSCLILASACFSGCGRPGEKAAKDDGNLAKAAATSRFDELHERGTSRMGAMLSDTDLQALTRLQQACLDINLSKIKEISGPVICKVASPEEFSGRIQLCDHFNAANQRNPMRSQVEILRALEIYLNETVKQTRAAEFVASFADVSKKIEDLTETYKKNSKDFDSVDEMLRSFDKAYIKLLINRADIADKLAVEYGLVVSKEGMLIPVAATISQPGAEYSFIAHVVHYPEGMKVNESASTDPGGFIKIDLKKITPDGLNIILANEFAHQILSREGIELKILSSKIDEFKPAQPFHELMAYLPKDFHMEIKPTHSSHVSELYSDSWSTKVNPKDVNRIIYHAFYHVIVGKLIAEKDNLSPDIRKIVDRVFLVEEGYTLSHQYAFYSLIGCYGRDGKQDEPRKQMKSLQEFGTKLTTLFLDLDKTMSEFDKAVTQDNSAKIVFLGEKVKMQMQLCEEADDELHTLLETLIKEIPDAYRDSIQRSLEHYAEDYIRQAKKLPD